MATTINQTYNGRVLTVTVTAGKNEASDPVDIGGFSSVSVRVNRTTGTVQDGTIQVSNDGVKWDTAHSTQWVTTTGDGGNLELLNFVGDAAEHLHDILEHARYARLLVSNTALGDTDVLEAVFVCRK